MRKRSGAAAFGVLFGIFSLLYSFIVLFVLFDREDAVNILGSLTSLAICLFGNNTILEQFTTSSLIIGLGGFVFAILGIIAAGMRKHYAASGILLLISTIGVFFLYYYPLLFGYSGGIIGTLITSGLVLGTGMKLVFSVITLATMLFTLFGVIGSIISFFPKQVSSVQTYNQPYVQPMYQQPSSQDTKPEPPEFK